MGLCHWTCGELVVSTCGQLWLFFYLQVCKYLTLRKGELTIHFFITLQGKPSAGKSTFFNAAVQQNHAKTAAHPFTTIEPNISKGYHTIPCPCHNMDFTCDAGQYLTFKVIIRI